MEDFYYAGGLPAVMREIAAHARHATRSPSMAHAGREHRRRAVLEPRRHQNAVRNRSRRAPASPCCAAISRRTARSSNPRRPRRSCCSIAGARWCSRASRISTRASTTRTSTSTRTRSWCSRVAGPRVIRAWPRWATCRCRPNYCAAGITDILRISDARMSGTAYGTVVLHVSPEAAAGGPLALVRNGDFIEVDVPARRLHLDVSESELAERRAELETRAAAHARLVQAVRRPRAAGAPGRRSRRAGGQERRQRHPRLPLGRCQAGKTQCFPA